MNAVARFVAATRALCDERHLPAFLFFQLLAALVSAAIFASRVEPRRRAAYLAALFVGAPAGAIALGLAIRSSAGWLSAWGALAGAIAAVAVVASVERRSVVDVVDALAPALGALVAIGRLGCLVAGCDHGAPSIVSWAVPNIHDGALVHPTQLYESLLGIAMIVVAEGALRRSARSGSAVARAIVVYACGRFVVELLRGDVRPTSAGLTVGQWLALAALGFVVALAPRPRDAGSLSHRVPRWARSALDPRADRRKT